MLCTGDRALARKIASELEKHNQIRQSQEQAILKEAVGKIEGPGGADFLNDRAIVCAGEGWNAGVIGIVASRLVERYNRPVFVLAREGDTYVGSARSIRGVSLFESLHAIGDVFLRYGGHDMAAGLTLAPIACRSSPAASTRSCPAWTTAPGCPAGTTTWRSACRS